MSLSQITLEDLMILKTDILICRFLKGIWLVWLFKEKLEGYDYFSINQLQIRTLGQEYKFEKAKESCKANPARRLRRR